MSNVSHYQQKGRDRSSGSRPECRSLLETSNFHLPARAASSNGLGNLAVGHPIWPDCQARAHHRGIGGDGVQAVNRSLTVRAIGPNGPFTVKGQTARSLVALVKEMGSGVTALEVSSWALRFAAYCHDLRHKHGLVIDTIRESHAGGWHGRHVLRSPVEIVEVIGDE